MILGLRHAGDRAEMIGVAGEDLLAILDAFGEPALDEIDDGPLVVCFSELGGARDEPRDQDLGLVELITTDREPHLAECLIVLGRVGAEPDGPKSVLGHGPNHRILVAQSFAQDLVTLLESAHEPERQYGGAACGDVVRGGQDPAEGALVVSRGHLAAKCVEVAVIDERLEVVDQERPVVSFRHGRDPHSPMRRPVPSKALARAWNGTDATQKQTTHFSGAEGCGPAMAISLHKISLVKNRRSLRLAGDSGGLWRILPAPGGRCRRTDSIGKDHVAATIAESDCQSNSARPGVPLPQSGRSGSSARRAWFTRSSMERMSARGSFTLGEGRASGLSAADTGASWPASGSSVTPKRTSRSTRRPINRADGVSTITNRPRCSLRWHHSVFSASGPLVRLRSYQWSSRRIRWRANSDRSTRSPPSSIWSDVARAANSGGSLPGTGWRSIRCRSQLPRRPPRAAAGREGRWTVPVRVRPGYRRSFGLRRERRWAT